MLWLNSLVKLGSTMQNVLPLLHLKDVSKSRGTRLCFQESDLEMAFATFQNGVTFIGDALVLEHLRSHLWSASTEGFPVIDCFIAHRSTGIALLGLV